MALRINTNIASITAMRNLRAADAAQRKSLERLSTGLRINRAADDPSGLVISEQLRAQIASMKQALRNSQDASNLVGTAEAALNEVNSLLVQIRESVVFALNTGAASSEEIEAEQDAVDNAISAIDRIAQTTSFGTKRLLDGSAAIKTASTLGSGIKELNIQNVQFDGNSALTFTVQINSPASQAALFTGSAYSGASNNTVIRITGPEGTEEVTLASSFTSTTDFDNAVNAVTGSTGVYASGGKLYSVDYGSSVAISLEVVSGTLTMGSGALTSASSVQRDTGTDAVAYINGSPVNADGNTLRVVSEFLTGDIILAPGTTSNQSFKLQKSGLVFQLNDDVPLSDRERIGIRSIDSSYLGMPTRSVKGIGGNTFTIGGYLSSLKSGQSNDLSSNPENALRIVDAAINDITDLRAYLGAFKQQTIDTNINSLSVAVENLTASESTIRDLDFAAETAEFTRSQVLFQSGIAVLAQTNLISQSVLSLLG